MTKSIIIIGSGMGGMAAGTYGQINGYDTEIFEMHTKPGGQCTAWKRKGYTFDACIHHFFGCRLGSIPYRLWYELGAMPRELVSLQACTAVTSADGKIFKDYYDLDRLEKTLLELAPVDSKPIKQYVNSIDSFSRSEINDAMLSGSFWKMIKELPAILSLRKWMNIDMRRFADRFSDPFLHKAFSHLVYSNPDAPYFFHLLRHAGGLNGDIKWPVGGAAEFSKSIERRYLSLGGTAHYGSSVEKILVENDKAVGIKLADGNEHRADIVISNADGRKTILNMLDGRYMNDIVLEYCKPLADETPFAIDIFLGVDRDLSNEPSSLVLLLEKPVTIADHEYDSIEAQLYGFDKSMAPDGKGTIKVELPASYRYWKSLYNDNKEEYRKKKHEAGEKVIDVLDSHFPGIRNQVEVRDISTLMTWERYMGGTQGWFNFPNRKFEFSLKPDLSDKKFKTILPGLSSFYFVGAWATNMGSLFDNANSGKKIIERICKEEGKNFQVQT